MYCYRVWGWEVWDCTAVNWLVSVTSWLVGMVSVSGLSLNVNKLAVSVGYDLVAPKPSSQVVVSGSGRVSTFGSVWTSGATLIPRPSRARELVTMDEVGSGRIPSLERVTTGVGSASGAETKKLNSLGTSSRPSWLGLSVCLFVYCVWQFKELDKTLQI